VPELREQQGREKRVRVMRVGMRKRKINYRNRIHGLREFGEGR
jgi:hypothetical protein